MRKLQYETNINKNSNDNATIPLIINPGLVIAHVQQASEPEEEGKYMSPSSPYI
jgi:hypothetical protein